MSHFVIKCERCSTVIAQCRCADKNKPVQYQMCAECAGSTEPEETLREKFQALVYGFYQDHGKEEDRTSIEVAACNELIAELEATVAKVVERAQVGQMEADIAYKNQCVEKAVKEALEKFAKDLKWKLPVSATVYGIDDKIDRLLSKALTPATEGRDGE